jgi:nucleoside-diphosphate-sugar epimerase
MKVAIVTGSTGLIGRAVSRLLFDGGYKLLCLGRRDLSAVQVCAAFGRAVTYRALPMSEMGSLPTIVKSLGWDEVTSGVFFHFAWSGPNRLTDGSYKEQMQNVAEAANAVKTAKDLGLTRFVNAGTLEESFIERHLKEQRNDSYHSPQLNYGLAKLAARDICKLIAYLEKIDYIHTRLSAPIDPQLQATSYISTTIKRILAGESIEMPKNQRFFDFISVDEAAKAYKAIGEVGKNKADYLVGSGKFMSLSHFFSAINTKFAWQPDRISAENEKVDEPSFSVNSFVSDLGFQPAHFFETFYRANL